MAFYGMDVTYVTSCLTYLYVIYLCVQRNKTFTHPGIHLAVCDVLYRESTGEDEHNEDNLESDDSDDEIR